MGVIADKLRELPAPKIPGCGVCSAYEGKLDGWDEDDAAALRAWVDSDTGYKAIGAQLKGSGVSADAIRLHRRERHG